MRDLAPGTMIDDRYRIVTRLGSGGMADVYCAEDNQLGRRVALKILYERFAEDEEFVERFRREASHAAGLQHQHVVGVYDRGEWNGTSYIAMEYVDGRTLKQVIQAEAPLEPLRAIDLAVQILRAARFAHRRGVIHRDLKPHNVMIDVEDRAKVTDFGIARAGASDMTQTGSIMGTAQYLSPEQAQGHPVSATSDIYSIGIVLYEMLTGQVPFDGDSPVTVALKQVNTPPTPPSQLNPDVPAPLEAVTLKALAKDPADRYPDAEAFMAALDEVRQQIIDGTAPSSQATTAFAAPSTALVVTPARASATSEDLWGTIPPGPLEEPPPRERRPWWPWALLGTLLVAAAIVAVILLSGGKTVRVPDVRLSSSTRASTRLHSDGLEVTQQSVTSSRLQGTVVGQDPAPGAEVDEGSTVTLTVSSGPGEAQVPDVNDLGRNAARKVMSKAGFEVRPDKLEPSETVVKNHVIRTNPPAFSQLDIGSNVQLVVSSGPPPVEVPPVTDQTVDDATATLRDAGFKVSVVNKETEDADPGTVLEQAPSTGQAPKGSTVTLTVASAPKTVTIPDVTGETEADAAAALAVAGLKYKTVDSPLTSEDGDGTVITQDPPGGPDATAKRGTTVTITIGRFSGTPTP
ncbi:MAG TPA: Stk1 family PASTA domain-containing Ser/Thr kinase [Solirubrobacteraceae bacterium]|nr:Stk1 family PASTA domain-containing Ser/Thr kinase [Solirubrobacteraceae bacterium]